MAASHWSRIVSRSGTSFAALAGPDGAAEGAGAVEEEEEGGFVCFAEGAVGEGKCRCSGETVGRAVERSGRSLAVRTRAKTVEEGNQETRAEAAGRKLFREHHATRRGPWNIRTVPTVRRGWPMGQ